MLQTNPGRNRISAVGLASLILGALLSVSFANAEQPAQSNSGSSGTRVQLEGSVHPLAQSRFDTGRMPAATPLRRMILELKRTPAQQQDLNSLLSAQQDATSPSYHKWLTPDEFGARFGLNQTDQQKVTSWLSSQGLTVERVARGGGFVLFSGTVGTVEQAFATEIHSYNVNGKNHIANAKSLSLPTELADVVAGVHRLNNFFPHPQALHYAQITFGDGVHALAPADLATIYDLNPLYTSGIKGDGQQIAIIGTSNINVADLDAFRSIFGLPTAKLKVIVDGEDPGLVSGDEVENINDVSWSGAVAPNATINLVVAGTTELTYGTDISAAYTVDNNVAPVVSMSYGNCELGVTPGGYSYYGALWEQAAAQGQSVFVSSGDSGAAGCDYGNSIATYGYSVNEMGSSPFNVSVGGTEFLDSQSPSTYWATTNGTTLGSALSYIPEAVWNESYLFGGPVASGGGVSTLYQKPSWQTGIGVPQDGLRDLPDISLHAAADNDPYLFCESDLGVSCSVSGGALYGAYGVGGTSLSSPAMAGIMALINQKTATIWGNPNPIIYALAASTPTAFHDVTVGDNKVTAADGSLVGYAAGTGFDLATGWGSVDAKVLVNAWSAVGSGADTVTLSTSSTHVNHAQGVNLTVAVTPTTGTTQPTGQVGITGGSEGIGFTSLYIGSSTFPAVLPGGTHSYTAYYAGDSNYAVGYSAPVTIQVDPETSGLLLLLGSTPASLFNTNVLTYGNSQIVRAEVLNSIAQPACCATGTVLFSDGAKALMTVPVTVTGNTGVALESSVARAMLPLLTVGSHTIELFYSGDQSYNSAPSNYPFVVLPAQSGIILEADHTQPAPNSTINITAYVYCTSCTDSAAPMTGSILFTTANGVALGTVQLPKTQTSYSGLQVYKVTLAHTVGSLGSFPVTASYSGDLNVNGTIGSLQILVTGKSTTRTSLALSNAIADPSTGQLVQYANTPVQLSFAVAGDTTGAAPTGSVVLYDGSTQLATATLGSNGTVSYSLTGLAVGSHLFEAVYQGDSYFLGSQSSTSSLTVVDYTLTLAANASSVVAGQTSAPISLTVSTSSDAIASLTTLTLNCGNLPAEVTCVLTGTPAFFSSASGGYSANATVAFVAQGPTLQKAGIGEGLPRVLLALLAISALLSFCRSRKRIANWTIILILGLGFTVLSGCSGVHLNGTYRILNPGATAGVYPVTVTSTLGADIKTQTITLTVTSAVQ